MKHSTFAVLAGGGTAGHVNPALAIAEALVARGRARSAIRFVGSRRGLEAKLVPAAGFDITLLPGRGIVRRFSPQNVGAAGGLVAGLFLAIVLLVRSRPEVVISVGGYASAPAAIAAVLLRIPLVLAESNAVPGAANRLVARFARASAVALPGTNLPRATVTGNPVRPEIESLQRDEQSRRAARDQLGLPHDRLLVGVFGGSLGSRTINLAVWDLLDRWRSRTDIAVRHAVGRRDWTSPEVKVPRFEGEGIAYSAVEYEDHMELFLTAVDLVICRAGSTTVAEVSAVGLPAVFVPLPNAPGDHQMANARALESAGGAVLIPDAECDGVRLDAVLTPLVEDASRRAAMAEASRTLAVPAAADRVAALVESCAGGAR